MYLFLKKKVCLFYYFIIINNNIIIIYAFLLVFFCFCQPHSVDFRLFMYKVLYKKKNYKEKL